MLPGPTDPLLPILFTDEFLTVFLGSACAGRALGILGDTGYMVFRFFLFFLCFLSFLSYLFFLFFFDIIILTFYYACVFTLLLLRIMISVLIFNSYITVF